MSSYSEALQRSGRSMGSQTQEAAAKLIIDEFYDFDKRSRWELANPPQEVIDAGNEIGLQLDKYKVYEVEGDGLTYRYALSELKAAKNLAELHRFRTGKAVVVKTSKDAKRASYRLEGLKDNFQ